MKQPEENQVIQNGTLLSDNASWGSYNKKTGWTGSVATGKAVREYILALKTLIVNLLNTYNLDKQLSSLALSLINSQLLLKANKSDVESSLSLKANKSDVNSSLNKIKTTASNITANSNQVWVDDSYKTISVTNGDGTTTSFIVLTKKLQTQTYYTYRYKLMTSEPSSSPTWSTLTSTNSSGTSSKLGKLDSVTNWFGNTNLYIVLPAKSGKTAITDYINLDSYSSSLLSACTISIKNNMAIIKWDGFSPLNSTDSDATLTIK